MLSDPPQGSSGNKQQPTERLRNTKKSLYTFLQGIRRDPHFQLGRQPLLGMWRDMASLRGSCSLWGMSEALP